MQKAYACVFSISKKGTLNDKYFFEWLKLFRSQSAFTIALDISLCEIIAIIFKRFV